MLRCLLVPVLAAGAALGQSSLSNASVGWSASLDMSVTALAVDGDGDSYLLGFPFSGFVPTNPVYGAGVALNTAVVKLDPSGNLMWSTGFLGAGSSELAVDAAKNVYI